MIWLSFSFVGISFNPFVWIRLCGHTWQHYCSYTIDAIETMPTSDSRAHKVNPGEKIQVISGVYISRALYQIRWSYFAWFKWIWFVSIVFNERNQSVLYAFTIRMCPKCVYQLIKSLIVFQWIQHNEINITRPLVIFSKELSLFTGQYWHYCYGWFYIISCVIIKTVKLAHFQKESTFNHSIYYNKIIIEYSN